MNTRILNGLWVTIIVAVMAACQPQPRPQQKANQAASPAPKDAAKITAANPDIKPAETGYADVNGLKMYYEVYGEGETDRTAAWLFYEHPFELVEIHTAVGQRP